MGGVGNPTRGLRIPTLFPTYTPTWHSGAEYSIEACSLNKHSVRLLEPSQTGCFITSGCCIPAPRALCVPLLDDLFRKMPHAERLHGGRISVDKVPADTVTGGSPSSALASLPPSASYCATAQDLSDDRESSVSGSEHTTCFVLLALWQDNW